MAINPTVDAKSTVSEWNISTDIYDIVNSLDNLKARYINDEDETTLALGIFGYITDTEAKKIQTSTIMAGELGNEMFPTRAKLTKNVLAHAIYCNITDINAVPAHMMLNIGIKIEDLDTYMINNRFIFDASSPIFIEQYEFHFDYDIILVRSKSKNNSYVYSAHYDMTEPNYISNITDPYLKQPFVIKIGNDYYVIFQALVRQVTIEETSDKLISDSIIENKTFTFDFSNQIADFDVYVTDNGKTTRLRPIPYGSAIGDIDNYCWYLYITDNTIRVTFDSKSYIPGLNCDVLIRAYTTLGEDGIFNYKKYDESSDGYFVDFTSAKQGYDKVTCYMVAATDSVDGSNRKTKQDLQKLIPKAALSRGSITTETDVSNYFNLIDNEVNRLVMQKKVDNQLSRIWYGYFLLKDEDKNIIPTNSIRIKVNTDDYSLILADDGRYVLPAGTILRYNPTSQIAELVDEALVPELYSDSYFNGSYYYYMTVYNLIINPDPLYAAFYLTIINKDSFFSFKWVNEESIMQFIATNCNFSRNLLTDQQIYKFKFKIAQSISSDFGLYNEENVTEVDSEGNTLTRTVITNNMKCILVLYRGEIPYRYKEATLIHYDTGTYVSEWEIDMETDNELDIDNYIKIKDLNVVGYESSINDGYFEHNTKAVLYILGKFQYEEFGRHDLDDIVPGLKNYSVTNVYEVDSGLDFYENFTNVLDTKVKANSDTQYQITGVPVAGLHYMTTDEHASYLMDAILEKKAYIDYCLILLENSMNVDFKFFNTYGPSLTYSLGGHSKPDLKHVDLSLKFRVSLKSASDIYTKDQLIADIKAYIEDLYETGDWHAPNMITKLTDEYSTRINFIEFMSYNDQPLGIQHIEKKDVDDPHIVPEFLCVRNRYNSEGELEPCIDIELMQ